MTRSDHGDEPPSTGEERYGRFRTEDALVVYEREDTSRWLASDTVVSLADAC